MASHKRQSSAPYLSFVKRLRVEMSWRRQGCQFRIEVGHVRCGEETLPPRSGTRLASKNGIREVAWDVSGIAPGSHSVVSCFEQSTSSPSSSTNESGRTRFVETLMGGTETVQLITRKLLAVLFRWVRPVNGSSQTWARRFKPRTEAMPQCVAVHNTTGR